MDPDVLLQYTLVPNADTTKLRYFMDMLVDKQHTVMLIGASETVKSVIISKKLQIKLV